MSKKLAFTFSIISIYLLAWIIQNHIGLNTDVSVLMHEAKKLLAGGTYRNDFFETNPPLILYLNILPVVFKGLFNIQLTYIVRIYVFTLASISLLLCHGFIKYTFEKNTILYYLFFSTLAAIFLMLPIGDFGQREQLLVILSMPHILLAAYQLNAASVPKPKIATNILIGVLAGFGFLIKPHFLITFALIEIYYAIHKRNWLTWCRIETLIVICMGIAYVGVIFLFHRDYIYFTVPYTTRLYYSAFKSNLFSLSISAVVIYFYLVILMYGIFRQATTYKILNTIMCLALIGFTVSYVTQMIGNSYQLYPALSFAILLSMTLFTSFIQTQQLSTLGYAFLCLLGLLFFALLYQHSSLIGFSVFLPTIYFSFYTSYFLFLFVLGFNQSKNSWLSFLYIVAIIASGWLVSNIIHGTSFYPYRVAISSTVMIVFFCLLLPRKNKSAVSNLFICILGVLIFIFPFNYIAFKYLANIEEIKMSMNLTNVVHRYAQGHVVYFFSTRTRDTFPIIDDAGAVNSSRFPFLWMVPGLLNKMPRNNAEQQQVRDDKMTLINMICDDFDKKQPDYIFIDSKTHKVGILDPNFKYINYFSESPRFQAEWQHYRYVATMVDLPLYKFDIYQRVTA